VSNEPISVDPNKVIESLLRQIAEQAAKIATLEAYIGQTQSTSPVEESQSS
jgi:hypothetical protein